MEAKIFRDTIENASKLCDTKTEVSVETEILIPDYLPQIFKIVKCFVQPVILQKQAAGNRLSLEGYLRCVVFYQAEQAQKLCTAEQKVPFNKTLELPEYHASWVSVTAGGETEYLNCRAVNQRRIDIRGACMLTVRAFAQEECMAVTALSDAGMEQKSAVIDGIQQVAACDKLITCEDTLHFQQTPESVLQIDGDAVVQEVKLIRGKAVVKGQISTKILYSISSGELQRQEKTVDFNQILDLDGVEEGCEWAGWAEVTGCALMAGNGENGELLSVNAMLHLQVWRSAQRSIVSDAFSTKYQTELESSTLHTTTVLEKLKETVEVSCSGQLPDEGAQILTCTATICPPELVPTETGSILRGRAVAHIICLNSLGELDCYDRSCEYQLDKNWEVSPEQLDLAAIASLCDVTAAKQGDEATAKLVIRLSGLIVQRVPTTVVSGIECKEEWQEENGVALRIYYASAGEDVFDIARRYHASPVRILQTAGLEELILQQPAKLLIPVMN